MQKSWTRNPARPPPREDINAPDLYIPSMAVVTYVLLSAIQAGLTSQFHPQVLGESASKALITLLVDFLFVYIACYFLNVSVFASDLVAYTAYKFVSVIAIILPGVLYPGGLGTLPFYGLFLYVFSANAFFMVSVMSDHCNK
jgi:protein transport protein YIF1